MTRKETLQNIAENFKAIKQAMMSHATERDGLHFSHKMILHIISKADAGVHSKEIAQKLQVSPSAVSQIIDGLLEAKLIEKRPLPNDRRLFLLTLTKKGHKVVSQSYQAHLQRLSKVCNGISDMELKNFNQTLLKIQQNLDGGL